MIQVRDTIQITSLARAVRDNAEKVEVRKYNTKQIEKSFVGNAIQIQENGEGWYRKRFSKNECCDAENAVNERGFNFCPECGFLFA